MVCKDEFWKADEPVREAGGVVVRLLVGHGDGARNVHMRRFAVQPGASTPWHPHPWGHEGFVLDGIQSGCTESGICLFRPDSYVLIPPDERHQSRKQSASHPFRLLSIIAAAVNKGSAASTSAKSSAEQRN